MRLTYQQIEDVLVRLHDVDDTKRGALRGRFKHFQRLGWPEGANVGKGRRVGYDLRQSLSIVVAFELLQFGLTPERAVTLLQRMKAILPVGFLTGLRMDVSNPSHSYVVFDPAALHGLRDDPVEEELNWGAQTMWLTTTSGIRKLLGEHNWALVNTRQAILNLTSVLVHFQNVMRGLNRHLSDDILEEALLEWKRAEEKLRDMRLESNYGYQEA